MRRSNLFLLPFLVPLIALDVALIATGKLTTVSLLWSLATFAVVVFLYWFFRYRGQRVASDERTVRLARKAMAFSYLVLHLIMGRRGHVE
jgi:Ca2+/Na+ antiporter